MSDSKKVLPDIIPRIKFNLKPQEQFVNDRGIVFEHYAAIPSPIGLKDRGELRRSDVLDVVGSNGYIYRKVGEFSAVLVNNSKDHTPIEGGFYDTSMARLVLPKYYSKTCNGNKSKEIQLLPGDRVYIKDLKVQVPDYQRVEYTINGYDRARFPVICVTYLVDSMGKEYYQGKQFKIDKEGHIKWIKGRKNPGVDPETGKGRVYSIRYTYNAFWYVHQLINEIRVTNTEGKETPERLPYQVAIQREYCYYNQVKGDPKTTTKEEQEQPRTVRPSVEKIDDNKYDIKVDVQDYE